MDAYKRIIVSYFIYTICLLPVSATLVAILKEVNYKGYIKKKLFELMHKCNILSFKMYKVF